MRHTFLFTTLVAAAATLAAPLPVWAQTSAALPHVRAGKLRALAFASSARLALNPALPTVAETLPGVEAVSWYGLLAPAGIKVG